MNETNNQKNYRRGGGRSVAPKLAQPVRQHKGRHYSVSSQRQKSSSTASFASAVAIKLPDYSMYPKIWVSHIWEEPHG
jgi:hypothetical protein